MEESRNKTRIFFFSNFDQLSVHRDYPVNANLCTFNNIGACVHRSLK
jgi:hypothetical protein